MSAADLHAHLAGGQTHVCQCWMIKRRDGRTFGFTDHDGPLVFDGVTFMADSGLSAKALSATTGLSVNNTEAVGLLQSDAIDPEDITAGRFDGAEVTNWLVQWDNVAARQVKFRGTIGEITRSAGAFEAELRGLTDPLNQPLGRSFIKSCSAVLGDVSCGFDLDDPAYYAESIVQKVTDETLLSLPVAGFNASWFAHGRLRVLDGRAKGMVGAIKHDRDAGLRQITLWEPLTGLATGDTVRLEAGCDKRADTCREKFANIANFRGFPHIPGDDWLVSVPRASADADGGSLNR
ncbi:phage conserved hypothetical protein BR0599 [Cognatiyoonia koreensis]|uniref:Bacteriophage phiJL001 Gp84 C-terminal domain-containing protein n=1 Tax=Cognatiyoonia koreensis TaxID=364200 RepID=A0A1I0NSG7_9RHOB|nr:DUF2163 domain-containing protein [Cognatiyoonia koreensis]SEW04521.1 phage conserved hypothetical protein BR0599 [Cognatiyoonia koreensis]